MDSGNRQPRKARKRRRNKVEGGADAVDGSVAKRGASLSASKRAKEARKAFKSGDVESSKVVHDASMAEPHRSGGGYLKSVVYGGMDGIITTFAVVSAVVGGSLSVPTILIMGFANLLGDAISMGMGDFVSSTAETEWFYAERRREMWECENFIESERQEMVEIYAAKEGISEREAETIVRIISKNYDTFVDIMMMEELGLQPPDEDDSPAKNGLVTFGSFMLFGLVPLLPYVIQAAVAGGACGAQTAAGGPVPGAVDACDHSVIATADGWFAVAIFLTLLMLFLLGVATKWFTARPWWKSGLFTLFNGALAALASYLIALGVRALLPNETIL